MRKLLVLLFFFISFSFSATYYINATGSDTTGTGTETNPWATMSKAQNSSSNGDTVIWQNGSYLSPGASTFTTTMYITKRLYIHGEDCTHPENVVVRMSAATINSVFDVAATASGGSIGCMNLIGTGTQGDNVTGHMYLRTFLGNFTIHDIVLKDLNESASNYAIAFDSTSATNNITIINFTITNVSDVGIHVQTNAGPKNITIANGNFTMGDGTSTDYGIQFANGAPTSNAGPYLFENLTFTCSANCRNTFSTAMLLQGATSEVSNRDLLARNIQIGSQSNPWIGQALRVNRPFNHTYVNVSIFVNTSGTTARVPVQFDTTSNYVTFENCSFGNSTSYIEVANANNIVFDDGNNTVFYNNEIWLDSAADILFLQHADHNVSNPRIDSNRVYLRNGTNMAHFGCGSEGGDSNITDTTNCTIQHNTITYLTNITGVAHSIFFGSTNNSLMYNNTIIGGYYGFLSKGNANMMIRANRGYNQTQVCIYDKGGNNNTYRDNYCYKNETQYESDSQIVLIDGSSVSLPSRNLSFFNNTYNISSPASNITAMYILNPSTSNRIQSNFNTFQVENCTWGMFYNNTPRYNYSQWQTYSGLETDSTFVCPLTITLVNPSNSSNFSSNNISLDFDINGFGTDICKYSLDGGANVSLPTCQNTTLAPGFGKHYLQLHLNNTALQTASSLVHNFTIDVYKPLLFVQSPTNNSNFTGSVAFNYIVSENLTSATCSYSLDGGSNNTLSNCANTTKSPAEGRHTIIFFANDTVGNLNVSTQINFTVDSTGPTLSIESPINNTQYNTSSVAFDFTVSDPLFGVETCVYSLNGAANTSLSSCANTTLTLADGVYNVTFYSNDTGGNLRINGMYFFNVSASSSSPPSSSSDDDSEIRSKEVSVGIEFTDELLRISVELDGEPTEADISLLLVDPYSGEVFEGSTDRNGVLEVPLSLLEYGSYEAVVRVRGHVPVTEEFEYAVSESGLDEQGQVEQEAVDVPLEPEEENVLPLEPEELPLAGEAFSDGVIPVENIALREEVQALFDQIKDSFRDISDITTPNAQKALRAYEQAKKAFEVGDYENATSLARMALVFSEQERVIQKVSILESIREKPKENALDGLLLFILLCVLGALTLFILFRLKK